MKEHLETPQEIREQIWKELGRASQDRHHAWRTPVLATVASDGTPNARTVVLRSVDAAQQALRIYTDARSPKVSELAQAPHALFVFWSARLNWQLRVRVTATIVTDGHELQALWQRVQQSAAAADYLASAAPGNPRSEAPSNTEAADGVNHFAVVNAQVLEMDWLELGRGGHRRARLLPDDWQWLTP